MPILLIFVACGISRLARYNITATEIAAAGDKVKYFEGAPIPSSLSLVAVLAFCFHLNRVGDNFPLGVLEIASLRWHPLSFALSPERLGHDQQDAADSEVLS